MSSISHAMVDLIRHHAPLTIMLLHCRYIIFEGFQLKWFFWQIVILSRQSLLVLITVIFDQGKLKHTTSDGSGFNEN
jgi:hypothetical protein